MAKSKENKIVLLNNATLTYNGEVLTVETIKNVPTEALTQFFVGHFSKNYPFGDIVWAIGKELKERINGNSSSNDSRVDLSNLATSTQAEYILNGLNPLLEDGTRTYEVDECVRTINDIANADKLTYSVNLACLELVSVKMQAEKDRARIAELEAEKAKLEAEISARDKQVSEIKANQTKSNSKKKTKKFAMVAAVIALGVALVASVGLNIGQSVQKRNLEDSVIAISAENERNQEIINKQKEFIDSVNELAERLGYKEGMKDDNGNVITALDFIEKKASEDTESLKKEIADMKETIRSLGYEVDDGKTLSGIVKDVYDAFQEEKKNAVANEVLASYLHFANLLEDLGVSPEDIVDENGNLDTSKFDADVARVVEGALKNADHLKQVQDKIDASFVALDVKTVDENGNTVYKKATDYLTFADAIDDIEDAYDARYDAFEKSIKDSILYAFARAEIRKPNGAIYTANDFDTIEDAIDFLSEQYVGMEKTLQDYKNLIIEKDNLIYELRDEIDKVNSELDSAYDEIEELNDQIDDLKTKIGEQEKNNENQGDAGKEDEGGKVGPVAGEDKDKDNTGGNQRPGQREDGNGGSSDYDNSEENSL